VIIRADFTDEKSVQALKEAISAQTSSLDQVIYNAGVLVGWLAVTKVGLQALRQNIEVNVFGAYTAAAEFSPFVLRSHYPNRVFTLVGSNFGSITTAKENFDFHNVAFGTTGVNNSAVYDISKVCLSTSFFFLSTFSI
jgi:NAD(P)-dependent dehydrogenase (short-subunit alcohol dehydrogenase family)